MKNIRKIRLYLKSHKTDQKINLLWYFAGLVTIPALTGVTGVLIKLKAEWLVALIVMESFLLAFLSVFCAICLDKIRVASKHLKETRVTWEQIESDFEFGNAFEEATKEK